MTITPAQLCKRVEYWQRKLSALGISHFEIIEVSVADDGGNPDAQATARTSYHYDKCRFWFLSEWLQECSPEELDQVIIHEWLHVAFRDYDHIALSVESWMPARTFEDWSNMLEHEREGIIDRLATALQIAHS